MQQENGSGTGETSPQVKDRDEKNQTQEKSPGCNSGGRGLGRGGGVGRRDGSGGGKGRGGGGCGGGCGGRQK